MPDSPARTAAATAYIAVHNDARVEAERYASLLEKDQSYRPERIQMILERAPAAATALPILERLAAALDTPPDLRTAAQNAITTLRHAQLPPNPLLP